MPTVGGMSLLWPVALLSLAVAGGVLLGALHARGRSVPLAAGIGHALLALTGTVVLAVAVWQQPRPLAVNAALLLFALALVGGVFNLLFRLQGERPPGFMIGLHGATAVVALAVLWAGVAYAY